MFALQPHRVAGMCATRYWHRRFAFFLNLLAVSAVTVGASAADPTREAGSYRVSLRSQHETAPGSRQYHRQIRDEQWSASDTAVIVCDMWDSHHCLNAVRRVGELAPRMNALLVELRQQGATIIHAPSGCMTAYKDHPARLRAAAVPPASNLPADIASWCDHSPPEDAGSYPLDQSAGGEDDDLLEHQQWAAALQAAGRNPRAPWLKQTDALAIDSDRDFLSDSGNEIWSILEQQKIRHVVLVGVHTNMCVLGRPFGLRQLAHHGKQVALVRDLTDTMYDPRQWPYVSHFTGTDLIVDHIERFVCPTLTSSDFLGGQPFRFAGDRRPELAIVMAEDEYETEHSLPAFAATHLGQYRTQLIFGRSNEPATIPGIEQIAQADALLVSVRRRPLPPAELAAVRQFVEAGKPVIGIRTASHAFCLRNQPPANGLADWPEFDSEVFGGHYTNHYANDQHPTIVPIETSPLSKLAQSVAREPFVSSGSLYQVSPLGVAARPILMGSIPGQDAEPVAWTNVRNGGGRAFYTSLGHKGDFERDAFRLLLANGIHWCCDQPLVTLADIQQQRTQYEAGHGKQR